MMNKINSGLLPNGWTRVRIEDVVKRISNGIIQDNKTNGVPVTRIETIADGTINWSRVGFFSNPSTEQLEKFKLRKGDILFSHINSDTHLGKTAVFNDDRLIIHGINLLLIRPNKSFIESDYLHYLFNHFRSNGYFSLIAQHAVNQASINQAKIKQIVVPLPPLAEQRRIVEKIEKIYFYLDSVEKYIQYSSIKIEQLRSSLYNDCFIEKKGWKNVHLGNIADMESGMAFKQSEYSSEGIRLLQISNVSFGYIDWKNTAYLPKDYTLRYQKLVLKTGDILIALNRPILGGRIKVAMMNDTDAPAILYQRVGRIKVTNPIFKDYLFLYLQSPQFIKQLEKSLQGCDQPFITKPKLLDITVPLPPNENIEPLVNYFKTSIIFINNIQNYYSIKNLISITKKSILNLAFSGRLVPQDPNDEPASILLERIKAERANAEAGKGRTRQKVLDA